MNHHTRPALPPQGGDLAGALASDAAGELSWGRRGKDIALGIAEGLAYLHANNVTHRQAEGHCIVSSWYGAGGMQLVLHNCDTRMSATDAQAPCAVLR